MQTILELRKNATIYCPPKEDTANTNPCHITQGCLFDIESDPCERNNLAENNPEIVKKLRKKLKKFENSAMKPSNMPHDPSSDPKYWGYVWTNWKDFEFIH